MRGIANLAKFSRFQTSLGELYWEPTPMSRIDRKRPRIPAKRERTERLQVILPPYELAAIDEFRYQARMPSRAAAVRELLRRGLASAATKEGWG
jgi:hypothetical protein